LQHNCYVIAENTVDNNWDALWKTAEDSMGNPQNSKFDYFLAHFLVTTEMTFYTSNSVI